MEIQTQKMLRQRKMLLLLPLVMVAFTTLLFIALGGGQASASQPKPEQAGFNTRLPDARLKDERALNKMSYYDQAASDSQKLKEQKKTDPYYQAKPVSDTAGVHFPRQEKLRVNGNTPILSGGDPLTNEAKVYQKLAELQAVINKPAPENKTATLKNNTEDTGPATKAESGWPKEDPELRQMNSLLERILDIQHPERMREKTEPEPPSENKKFKAIPAVIDGNQKITQGTVVRLKLLDTITLNSQLIHKGQLIFASGNLYNQRLTLNIKNIRVGFTILPVDLTVFDMIDGLEGVNVPEAITGDALKDGAASGVQGVEFMSLDPSLTTQLAGAGLNTAKGLFSKKVKRIKAKLKDGHQLLLRNNKNLLNSFK